ncbi:TIGR03663 family protein [Dehalococcoidia bacterium]|nr:TIGR03663 family protein [Dehalococcoidia bacterium]
MLEPISDTKKNLGSKSVSVIAVTAKRNLSLAIYGLIPNFRSTVKMHPWETGAYVVIILGALLARLWDLGSRAIHHDESLHAFYAWSFASGHGYEHNPMMHGPFQIEASGLIFRMLGDSDFTARILYVIAGTILVGMPILLRKRLGSLGSLFSSVMLAISPTMLYFSRFARNDILIGVWTLGLVVCIWRYIDEGKNRYLYIAAILLSLAFSTKETAYLITVTLGIYLVMIRLSQTWPSIRNKIVFGQVSPPFAVYIILAGLISSISRILNHSRESRHAGLLVMLITLTLPLWAAALSVFQNTPLLSWSNLILATPVDGGGPIGAPLRGGNVLATYFLVVLGLAAVYLGWRWRWAIWWRYTAIFYSIFVILYTALFSNPNGLGSGLWQSLGCWVVQQGEARGSQPWYYYFLLGSIYEYLPIILSVVGAIYYLRRKDALGRFLVFWAIFTLGIYTVASEKMPWLLVNITLPIIILAGKFLGELVGRIDWRRVVRGRELTFAACVPLLAIMLYVAAFYNVSDWRLLDTLLVVSALGGAIGLTTMCGFMSREIEGRNLVALITLPLVFILLVLTIRTGWNVAYKNGDVPVEMLVYTQTTPDLARLAALLKEPGNAVTVTIDSTNGFNWPWHWYLRNNDRVNFVSYDGASLDNPPDDSVLVIHSKNQVKNDSVLLKHYSEGKSIKHRWWFPESYRGLTPAKFLRGLVDRESWRTAKDYFLHRKIDSALGSEDAYVYFPRGSSTTFEVSH